MKTATNQTSKLKAATEWCPDCRNENKNKIQKFWNFDLFEFGGNRKEERAYVGRMVAELNLD